MRTLVIGGVGSGGRAVAEALLPADGWAVIEGADLASAVIVGDAVLVDSLDGWVRDRMDAGDITPADLAATAVAWFTSARGDLVVLTQQPPPLSGPDDIAAPPWAEGLAAVTRAVADVADRVLLVVAGRVVDLLAPPRRPVGVSADHEDSAVTAAAGDVPKGDVSGGDGPVGATTADRSLGLHGDSMVPEGALDLSVNVLGDRPARHVLQAMQRVVEGSHPDQSAALVAVSSLVGLTADHVVLLPGAADAFWLLPHALRPMRAAVVHPFFTAADAALRACDIPMTRVPRDAADGWRLRPDRVPDDADLVVLGNPNNPTGTLDDPAAIASLCRPGRTVVVDESFMDFVVDGRSSLAGRVEVPGLVVLRSISEMWSVPGVRAGYLVAAPPLASRIRRHQQPWPVSSRGLAAIVAAADDEPWRTETAEGVARRRRAMVRRLERIDGVTVHEGAANFVLIEVAAGPAVHRALLARGVAVRPSTFPLLPPRFLRVAVRDAPAVEQLAVALEAVV